MSKFKFRLATLLKIRESTRDERRRALAEAYRADDMLRERIDETRSEMQNLMETCRKAVGPGAVNVDSLIDAQRYELLLQSQLHQLQQKTPAVGRRDRTTTRGAVECEPRSENFGKIARKSVDSLPRDGKLSGNAPFGRSRAATRRRGHDRG